MSAFTPAQSEAIEARGNVLIVAGAGAGKTRTLVERCLQWILSPEEQGSLDEVLMVTFTEAAASEMRKRLRTALEGKLDSFPISPRIDQQLALLESARIGTLHSFCYQLVRDHFYQLGLDPQLSILSNEEAILLRNEVLDSLFANHYAGQNPDNLFVRELIEIQGQGKEAPIRQLLLKLHHYTQTLPNPKAWFQQQIQFLENPDAQPWQDFRLQGIKDWCIRWIKELQSQPSDNLNAHRCAEILAPLRNELPLNHYHGIISQALETDQTWPKGKKTLFRTPLKNFYDELLFWLTQFPSSADLDPLLEDWNWSRSHIRTLLNLAQEFYYEFQSAKKDLAVLDFHDLEQFTLHLLLDPDTQTPTPIALHWQETFRLVFVDEYQDINAAQDAILTALARPHPHSNRFLVGDIKQSIYRFRLAAPWIFQNYAAQWSNTPQGKTLYLNDNFRSHEAILHFVNQCFTHLMCPALGGIEYDTHAALNLGAPDLRPHRQRTPGNQAPNQECPPHVELHLLLTENSPSQESTEAEEPSEAASDNALEAQSRTEREAHLVASRLLKLFHTQHPVWDESQHQYRPMRWSDVVLLMRSPRSKSEAYSKVFTRLQIPFAAPKGEFFESTEITDWLNLLSLIDNPLQDWPLLAVLRSPLVGLTVDELASIRLADPKNRFWNALQTFLQLPPTDTTAKVSRFLEQFARWRHFSRQTSVAHTLESIIHETHYHDWVLTQPRGDQKRANLEKLLQLARRFDQFHKQSLFRFLQFIEAQKESGLEAEPLPSDDARQVRLMSIHQSKGLEFPIVVLCDLGKSFNWDDLKQQILLDEHYGLCPQIQPPHLRRRYPSLPFFLAKQRQRQETLGEEIRLLYVALTRACDTLILTGSLTPKRLETDWSNPTPLPPSFQKLLEARDYLQWLALWIPHFLQFPDWSSHPQGRHEYFSWHIHSTLPTVESAPQPHAESIDPSTSLQPSEPNGPLLELRQRMEWQYPFLEASLTHGKTSVTTWRKHFTLPDEDPTPSSTSPLPDFSTRFQAHAQASAVKASDIGTQHHLFLQNLNLNSPLTREDLIQQRDTLAEQGVLAPETLQLLDLESLEKFFISDLGKTIRQNQPHLHRELPFTLAVSPLQLNTLLDTPLPIPGILSEERQIIQGIIDLVLILPDSIHLLDFKTSKLNLSAPLDPQIQTYKLQVNLYALAMESIYRRPVQGKWLVFLFNQRSIALHESPALSIPFTDFS